MIKTHETWIHQTYPYCKTLTEMIAKIRATHSNKFVHQYSAVPNFEFDELLIKDSNWRVVENQTTPTRFLEIQTCKFSHPDATVRRKLFDTLVSELMQINGLNIWVHSAVEFSETLELRANKIWIDPYFHYYFINDSE